MAKSGIAATVPLMENTRLRLEQDVTRLGGHYAHVTDEHIEIRQDDTKGESWLHDRCTGSSHIVDASCVIERSSVMTAQVPGE